jgi:hypothetical protein
MTLGLTGARARLIRIPIDLSARGQLHRGRAGFSLDLGLALTPQITSGLDVPVSQTETRLEVGLRLATRVEVLLGQRVAPFAMVHAEYIPVPFNLVLPGGQIVGTTPPYFIGAALGVAFRLR